MNAPAHASHFAFALLVLLVVHTAVSLSAYRWLAKSTVIYETGRQPSVDVTTPEQKLAGIHKIKIVTKTQVVKRVIPGPVLCYIAAGYVGLALAAAVLFVGWLRHGHV